MDNPSQHARDCILQILAKHPDGLNRQAIFDQCDAIDSIEKVSKHLFEMKRLGTVQSQDGIWSAITPDKIEIKPIPMKKPTVAKKPAVQEAPSDMATAIRALIELRLGVISRNDPVLHHLNAALTAASED